VELADERERHIAERHPELLPAHLAKIEQTLAQPDQIRRSGRFASARLLRGDLFELPVTADLRIVAED